MRERIQRAARLVSLKERELTVAKARAAEAAARTRDARERCAELTSEWEKAADRASRLDGVAAHEHLTHREALLARRARIAAAERDIARLEQEEHKAAELVSEARANVRKLEAWVDNMKAEEAQEQNRKERLMADEIAARRAQQRQA